MLMLAKRIKELAEKFSPALYFIILAFFVTWPLWKPGFLFFLDFVVTPNNPFTIENFISGQELWSLFPFRTFFWLLAHILSAQIAQKIILFSFFISAGLVFFYILPNTMARWIKCIAATFYVINPFIYERFMVGHIGLLLGYVFVPFTWYYSSKVFFGGQVDQSRKKRDIFFLILFWTIQSLCTPHYFIITSVVVLINFIVKIFSDVFRHVSMRSASISFLQVFSLALFINSWWILPSVFSISGPVKSFSPEHFQAYRASADEHYGLSLNLLSLYGFWRERTVESNEILLTKNFIPVWPISAAIFLIPIFFGLIYLWKKKMFNYLGALVVTGIFVVIFSYGPADNWLGKINNFIFLSLPGFRGLRESQKFISILVFIYAVLIAYGLEFLKMKKKWVYFLISCIVFLNIFIFNFKFLWGAAGQVQALQYPRSFIQAEAIFGSDKSDYKILILPWHMYLVGHPLAQDRTIVDPAPQFFANHTTLYTTNEEMEYAKADSASFEEKIRYLQQNTDPKFWYEVLKSEGVKYIFITKVQEPQEHGFIYDFLVGNSDFTLVLQDGYAALFELSTAK